MLQPSLRQIEAMGVETVQSVATMVIVTFLIEWATRIPFSTSSACKQSKLSLMVLWNILEIYCTESCLEIADNLWLRCQD